MVAKGWWFVMAGGDPQDVAGCVAAIMSGNPSTLTNAGNAFDTSGQQTEDTCGKASSGATGIGDSWQSPACDAFGSLVKKVTGQGRTMGQDAKAVKSPLDDASAALTDARSQIQGI